MACTVPPLGITSSTTNRPRNADERVCDEPQYRQASRDQAGPVHHVAQDQPVPHADNEAGTEHERPIANRNQRSRVVDQRTSGHAGLVVQRDDRKVADDADRDERAFHETRGHISEREECARQQRETSVSSSLPSVLIAGLGPLRPALAPSLSATHCRGQARGDRERRQGRHQLRAPDRPGRNVVLLSRDRWSCGRRTTTRAPGRSARSPLGLRCSSNCWSGQRLATAQLDADGGSPEQQQRQRDVQGA